MLCGYLDNRNLVLKAGAAPSHGGRRLWFDLAGGMAPLWPALPSRFRSRRNAERPGVPKPGFPLPPPSHAFLKFQPRM
ncbi:MAG: hypothetical protein LBT97_00195 [Planctomycetota bacterium]|jgi:hypothetical protein|nr:hypothetical protein [Planctomycetota bacterium]